VLEGAEVDDEEDFDEGEVEIEDEELSVVVNKVRDEIEARSVLCVLFSVLVNTGDVQALANRDEWDEGQFGRFVCQFDEDEEDSAIFVAALRGSTHSFPPLLGTFCSRDCAWAHQRSSRRSPRRTRC
jgi:hypothetical protein